MQQLMTLSSIQATPTSSLYHLLYSHCMWDKQIELPERGKEIETISVDTVRWEPGT